jgi:MoxR-like ATPase
LFAQIVLADEINRATPRTQSALLEAMEERQVTADGTTMPLERPFVVIATQNPIELEGTFPLPEAQLDRFMVQLSLGYPDEREERAILRRNDAPLATSQRAPALPVAELRWLQQHVTAVHVSEAVEAYIVALVRRTRSTRGIALGAGPRASIALFRATRALACMRGRGYVLPDDVKQLAAPVLAHRLLLAPEARLAGELPRTLIARLLDELPVPVEPTPPLIADA